MYMKQTESFVSKHNNPHNYKLPCARDIQNDFVKRKGELVFHIKVCLQVLGSWLYQYGCENVVKSYCGSRGSCVKFNSLPKMMSHESAWPGAEDYFESLDLGRGGSVDRSQDCWWKGSYETLTLYLQNWNFPGFYIWLINVSTFVKQLLSRRFWTEPSAAAYDDKEQECVEQKYYESCLTTLWDWKATTGGVPGEQRIASTKRISEQNEDNLPWC